MAKWRHTGGDPLDYHNYEPIGEDEGCGSFLFAILLVVIVVVLISTYLKDQPVKVSVMDGVEKSGLALIGMLLGLMVA